MVTRTVSCAIITNMQSFALFRAPEPLTETVEFSGWITYLGLPSPASLHSSPLGFLLAVSLSAVYDQHLEDVIFPNLSPFDGENVESSTPGPSVVRNSVPQWPSHAWTALAPDASGSSDGSMQDNQMVGLPD